MTTSKELSCDQGYSWGEHGSMLSERTKGAWLKIQCSWVISCSEITSCSCPWLFPVGLDYLLACCVCKIELHQPAASLDPKRIVLVDVVLTPCVVTPCGQTDVLAHHKKHFLPFRILLNVGIDPNFPQKKCFSSFLALFREKFCFPTKTFLA